MTKDETMEFAAWMPAELAAEVPKHLLALCEALPMDGSVTVGFGGTQARVTVVLGPCTHEPQTAEVMPEHQADEGYIGT